MASSPARPWRPRLIGRWIKRQMPKTLFGRSLLIIVLPVAIMQIAVTYVFFDAHWQTVTSRLSEGLAGDIAWAVESYQEDPSPASFAKLSKRAEDSMSLSIACSRDASCRPGHAMSRCWSSPSWRLSTNRCAAPCPSAWTPPSGSTRPATRPTSTSAWRCRAG